MSEEAQETKCEEARRKLDSYRTGKGKEADYRAFYKHTYSGSKVSCKNCWRYANSHVLEFTPST